jgi:ubiquinone biosynthesis monooxygenase Coq7
MIRVDHAGEFGAMRIYAGQLAVLGRAARTSPGAEAIRKMAAQEQGHFDVFDRMVKERNVRPTALEPVWHVAGYALGAATALMGEKAAMACTVAVEDVIDEHYARQLALLSARPDPELTETVHKFRDDERAHREDALAHDAQGTPGYPWLTAAIRLGCRVAIRLSERI